MKRFFILVSLASLGCANARTFTEAHCDTVEAREAATFVIECSKAANPMSDEEGEDLVAQCHATARELFCSERWRVVSPWEDGISASCDDVAKGSDEQKACRRAGWNGKDGEQ